MEQGLYRDRGLYCALSVSKVLRLPNNECDLQHPRSPRVISHNDGYTIHNTTELQDLQGRVSC